MELFDSNAFWGFLTAVWGAVLGASFYVLMKTQPYLTTRSYDPKYNTVYFSRFITGVVAGIILGTALSPLISSMGGSPKVGTFSQGVLGILGGYAAEAVELILQRLVEILLSVVRGDGSEQAKNKATADQAAKSAKVQELLPELESARSNEQSFKSTLDKIRAALKTPGL